MSQISEYFRSIFFPNLGSMAIKRGTEFLQQEVLPALMGLWHMYFRLL